MTQVEYRVYTDSNGATRLQLTVKEGQLVIGPVGGRADVLFAGNTYTLSTEIVLVASS